MALCPCASCMSYLIRLTIPPSATARGASFLPPIPPPLWAFATVFPSHGMLLAHPASSSTSLMKFSQTTQFHTVLHTVLFSLLKPLWFELELAFSHTWAMFPPNSFIIMSVNPNSLQTQRDRKLLQGRNLIFSSIIPTSGVTWKYFFKNNALNELGQLPDLEWHMFSLHLCKNGLALVFRGKDTQVLMPGFLWRTQGQLKHAKSYFCLSRVLWSREL